MLPKPRPRKRRPETLDNDKSKILWVLQLSFEELVFTTPYYVDLFEENPSLSRFKNSALLLDACKNGMTL